MSEREIRLVAIDLDGTLLDSRKKVCPAGADALSLAAKRGVRVVIASARPPRSVRPYYACLGIDTWQINYNGALIWDEPAQRVVEHKPMDPALVLSMARRARSLFPDVLVSCEIVDKWYTDRLEQSHTTATGRLFAPDVIAPIEDYCTVPMTKLMLLGTPEMMRELRGALIAEFPEVGVLWSDPDLLQIMDRGADKAVALKHVAKHYGVPLEQVLAIGDAENDIPMLRVAGVGVAVANAPAEVQNVADWIAPSNEDRGVHAALERFGVT